ncbi:MULTISPECIES: M23 family metallopeptidase [unclassified Thioclava]|uniref:M23 family metallopeptidase n=1 Tax=unclassified Thioclava TaxID=2621713 RepID=UPI000B544FF6|nr:MULTISPECIES: M23 family metallopeptidase [unclassified Thioclava]OWY05348.1 peptidase M23 [Thioclava sp. F1Mire-8]OWY07034.1 peptidase M23 [Thioclava sp. IC9]OWY10639.1 peptidase M23 [Thioclava sp. F42-5]PWE49695.1 peptidase M23 [Thioclava sp. NG1]
MPRRILDRLNTRLERILPEQRLFLKSDSATRFVRLRPLTQASVLAIGAGVFVWSMVATSMLFIDGISSGGAAQNDKVAKIAFERRLDALSQERDARAAEALAAQDRFQTALEQVSKMQSTLLASEERKRELETGIGVIQATLRRTMEERDNARLALAKAEGKGPDAGPTPAARAEDMAKTVDMLTSALGETAKERDTANADAKTAQLQMDKIALQKRLLEQRNDEIFTTLEGAVKISMEPLDKVFKQAGMDPDHVLKEIKRGYSGTGGPLSPISLSTKGTADLDGDTARAENILRKLDEMNMYRIAVDKLPLSMPVKAHFRFSSPFGWRWGRMHEGVDMAAPIGTKVYAPADGVVIAAEHERGYGNIIKIRHDFGITTRYGHLNKFHVKVGQKVSQGEWIADMGNTGHSTGPHLHYEVRLGGKPINPMTFIKAGKNVF